MAYNNNMKKEIKNLHSDTHWTPPGYTKEEWQEIWQKLWLYGYFQKLRPSRT